MQRELAVSDIVMLLLVGVAAWCLIFLSGIF